jgi:2-polyprenyl-3-methyl-5-hydroxy-6-metoxy-1,4-benzoquinol methylase
LCGPEASSRLFAPERIDYSRLDSFAFASRKKPEYMHLCLHECDACRILYASPIFSGGALADAYLTASYDSTDASRFAAQTYGRLARQIASHLPSRDGILDVGAGDGAFLAEAIRAGFSGAVGVEPSSAPIQVAAQSVRPFLRHEMFSAANFTPASFSLITCFQTIEHLADPLLFCRDAATLLRRGGALMLVGHNRLAISARLLGSHSPIYDLEHLQLFCPKSFNVLLRNAGLRRIRVFPVWNRYPLAYWIRLFPMPEIVRSKLGRFCEVTGAGRGQIALPAGNMVAVAFRDS